MGDIILTDSLVKKIAKETAQTLKSDKNFIDSVCAIALKNGSVETNKSKQKMLTTDDIIEISGFERQVILRHIRKGLLQGNKIGKRFLFTQENVNNYLKSNKDNE
jgi:hypothetical protein